MFDRAAKLTFTARLYFTGLASRSPKSETLAQKITNLQKGNDPSFAAKRKLLLLSFQLYERHDGYEDDALDILSDLALKEDPQSPLRHFAAGLFLSLAAEATDPLLKTTHLLNAACCSNPGSAQEAEVAHALDTISGFSELTDEFFKPQIQLASA